MRLVIIAVAALLRCAKCLVPLHRSTLRWTMPRSRLRFLEESSSQSAPIHFEKANDALRVAKRIETVLSRRTARLILILERLADGHNYSAIFRTCESMGIQQIWIIGPPAERYSSRRTISRVAAMERGAAFARADDNRKVTDDPVKPGSRRARARERAGRGLAWAADAEFDADHAMHGRGAARFLTIRDFENVEGVLAALKEVPDCELWASDLGQAASVLVPGAPWMGPESIPKRVALCLGALIARGLHADCMLIASLFRPDSIPKRVALYRL